MPSSQQSDPQKNLNQFNKFLENNVDFLKQKFSQHYLAPFPFYQLQTKWKIQTSIKFIYDVFSFQKYQKDEKMNATLKKSLRQNILGFIKISPQQKNDDKKEFKAQQAIKLLKYCIQNNQMFAVHYDKKQKQKKSPQKVQQQNKPQNQDKQQQQINKSQDQKQLSSPQKSENIISNIHNSPLFKKKNQHLSEPQQQQVKQQNNNNNQFSSTQKTEQQIEHLQLLKKQAKLVFEFYCKQQLNTGTNSTFDKILHESSTMTLGKFIAFVNTTGILYITKIQAYKPKDHKVLDKKTVNQIFRKIGKGQKQINFQQFFQVLKCLNQIDNSVYEKLNMNKDQTHNKIIRKLKYLNAPFAMKGPFAKDIENNVDQKPFVPINTAHSGRFQNCLKQDMEDRRQKLKLLPYQPYPNPNPIKIPYFLSDSPGLAQSMLRQSKFVQNQLVNRLKSPNSFLSQKKNISKTAMNEKKEVSKIRLQNSKISSQDGQRLFGHDQIGLLQNLIVHEQGDNDDQFLKDYKIPKLHSNSGLKKKPINFSHLSKNLQQVRQQNFTNHDRYRGIKTQRKNIVDELKQRVKQIQKTQRKQLTSLQNKRKSISISSSYNNRY